MSFRGKILKVVPGEVYEYIGPAEGAVGVGAGICNIQHPPGYLAEIGSFYCAVLSNDLMTGLRKNVQAMRTYESSSAGKGDLHGVGNLDPDRDAFHA